MAVTFIPAEDLVLEDVAPIVTGLAPVMNRLIRARSAVIAKVAAVREAEDALIAAQAEVTAAETAFATIYAQAQAVITETV